MPNLVSTQLMSKGRILFFNEENHKYVDDLGNPYISVTTLIHKYTEEFISRLKKDNEFNYKFTSDFGQFFGKGTYRIVKDSIIFSFIRNDANRGSYSIEKFEENENEFSVDLMVIDSSLWEPLYYPIILYDNGVRVDSIHSNFDDGKSSVKYPFHGNPIVLKIGGQYQYPLFIELNKPGQYSIHAKMEIGVSIFPTQKRIFRIEKLSRDTIIFGSFENKLLQKLAIKKQPNR